MKKITLLIVALLFSAASYSQFPTPGTEGFEGTTGPDLAAPTTPSPWTLGTGATGNQWAVFDNGVGLTKRWNITTVAANVYAGTNSAYMDRENIGLGNTSEDYLATPLVTVPTNGQLRFWTRSTINGANGTEYLIKVYDNAVATAGAQTTIANYTQTPQQWTEATLSTTYNVYEEKVVDLSAFAGHQVYIAFVMRFTQPTASLGGDRWLVDDIRLVQQCLAPTGQGATPQATTASLSWTDTNGSTSWEIENILATATPTGTGTVVTSNPYIQTGLTANTAYQYYVRSICSGGLTSAWVGPFAYTTTIAPIGCGGNFVDSGGSTGSYSNSENITTLICPSNTTDLVTVTFTSFATESGFDFLKIYDGSSASGTLLGTYSGTTLPPAFSSSTPGGCLTFVFTSDSSVSGAGWIANITCAPAPTCPKPTALATSGVTSSAGTLTWTNNSTATQFEVLALPCTAPAPTATSTGTIITPTTPNTYTFTGLTSDTCYTLYVRAVCSASDSSAWSTGINIQTQITPPACGGTFTDPGGASGNYANSANVTTTICPTNGTDLVTVSFTAFNLENNFDFLKVYAGTGTTGTLLGNFTGTTIPADVVSTAPGGCLTFVFTSDGSVTSTGWIANVTCAPAPTCPKPTGLATSGVTSNAGTLTWTNNSTATQFEVLALPCTSPAPTATSTGIIITPTTPNTYTFTGLTPDTCYTLYVRAVCSSSDSSVWSTGINIQTQIAPPVCGGTFTDPGGANGNYANNANVTTTICPTNPGDQVTVTFTSFNLENNFDFLSIYDGSSTSGALLGTYTGTTLPLTYTSSAVNGCLTFVFTSDGSVTSTGWVANVTCAPPPTCPRPTAVVVTNPTQNGATISWTEVGSATTWEVLVVPGGSPLPTASSTGIITTSNPFTINTLNSGAGYTVYVRAICSASDISLWSNPANFTTLITNDECANAIVAPVNPTTTCAQTVAGTVIGATNSSDPTTCGGTHDDDVWFQFTATSTTHTISLLNVTGSTTDLYHVVYSGTCGSLTQLYCSDPNTSTANNLVPGQTYYVRVYTYTATGNQTSAFNLCIGTPVPPPSCINNTPAGNTCAQATPICNLNGYCGNTSASYTADSWSQLSTAFCGSIENNSFLTFVASSSTISFDVWVTSSQFNNGIQIMVFSAATCGSGPVTSLTCWSTGTVATGSVNVSASGLTPGNTYYIMIDGFAGDVCSYVIASSSGITAPVLITPTTSTTTNTVCLGQTATLNASGGNGTYTWSPATGLNTTTGSTVIFTPTATGTYTFTATSTDSNPLCPQSASSSQTLVVTDIQTPTFTQIPSFCVGTTAPVLPTTSTNGISGTWSPSTVSNTSAGTTTYTFTPNVTQCATTTTMDITVNAANIPTFLEPAPICSGTTAPVLPTTSINGITGTWSPATVSNTASGTYTFTPDAGQCATTTTLNVTVNTNCSFGSYASAVWLTNCATSNFFNTVGSGADIIGPAANIFPNTNLGTYVQNSSSLILRGAEVKTFKNASSNVCSARLNYRIYPQSTTPGAFQVMDLPFFDNCGGATFPSGGPCQAGDQKWQRVVANGTTTPYAPIDLTNYPPGNYVLEVYYDISGSTSSTSLCNETVMIDNNGANYIASYTIQAQPTYVSTNPTTCSGNDGTITISGLAPGTNYTLTYNDDSTVVGPNTITTNGSGEIILTGLNAGTYSNFLLEINSCSYPYNTPIDLVDPNAPSVTVNNPTVCQGTPATVTATPSVAGTYSYVWTVPSGVTNPGDVASFDAPVSGTYSVVITNTVSGCSSASASSIVTINPTITPTFAAIAPLCLGATAPVLPTSSNNTTPVTGTWNPSIIDTSTAGTASYVFTPDSGQCSVPVTVNVTVNSVAAPTVVVVTQPTCATPTGTVQVTAPISSVAVAPTDLFISEVTDSNAGSLSYVELYNGTGSAINLSSYSIQTASNGNAYSFTLPLNNVSLASGSTYVVALGNDNYCPSTSGGDGSLAAQSSPSGSVNFSNNGNDHFGLFNGTTLIDSWGTFGSNNWAPSSVGTEGADFRRKNNVTLPNTTYNNNDWDVFDYAGTGNGSCANNDYSNIGNFTPLAATNTYQYNVDGGAYQTNPVFTGLTPGSHVITVQDMTTGCISTGVTVVLDPVVQNPSVTTFSYTTPVCINVSSTLTPDTTATGFTTGGTFSATPSGLTIDPNTGVVDLTTSSAGTYTITYSVNANTTLCLLAGSSQFTLVINPLPTVTVNSPSACQGNNATVTATPGTSGTYSYAWSVPAGVTNPGDVASFTTTVAGTYSVIITNSSTGCSSASGSGIVTINPTPTVTVNSPTVCQGQSATITATPGTSGTYNYVWTVPAGVSNPGNVATFTTTISGSYDVVITDTVTGCSSVSTSGIVTVNTNPTVTVTGDTVCQGSLATITANPGTSGTYSYAWTVPAGGSNPGDVATFTTSVAGTYTVVITNTATGCVSTSASGSAAFIPSFDFTISEGCVNNNYVLEVIPTSNSFDVNTAQFNWQYGTSTVGSNSPTFDVTAYLNSTSTLETLPLTFSVNVTTIDGCQQNHPITLSRIYCDIQKGISPNGDGLNDFFDLELLGVQQLSIYNRYGTKVYSRSDYTNQWIGQTDNGNELPDGTYYYVIEFKNNQSSKTGWIYINRETK